MQLTSVMKGLKKSLNLDISYFLKGGSWGIMQQVIGLTNGLIISYLFGHFVSTTLFGEYNLVLSIIGMLTFLSLPGIDIGLTQSISRGFDYSLIQSHRRKFSFSLLGIPIICLFAIYFFYLNKTQIAFSLMLIAFCYPLLYSYTNFAAFLAAKKKFPQLSLISIFSSFFFLLSTAISIFYFKSILGLIAGYIIGITVPSIFGYYFSKKLISNEKLDPHLPGYGAFLTFLSILPWISGNLGGVIIGAYLGVEQLAIYAVATRFLTAAQKNFQILYKPVTVKLASHSAKQHMQVIKKHSLKLLLIGGVLAAALWVTVPILIRFFFPHQLQSIIYAQILSLSLVPLPLTLAYTDMIIYQKRKRSQILIATIPQVIKIILFVIVIPIWHVNGLVFIVLLDRFTEPLIPLMSLVRSSDKT